MRVKVSCIDRDKFEKTEAYFGVELGDNIFEVFSIARFKNKKNYLLKIGKGYLDWYRAELFEIKDNLIPDFWIYKKFCWFYTIKNKKYNFSIVLKEFWGPEDFINDDNFLFDIYEEPEKANNFAYKVIKKYQ